MTPKGLTTLYRLIEMTAVELMSRLYYTSVSLTLVHTGVPVSPKIVKQLTSDENTTDCPEHTTSM